MFVGVLKREKWGWNMAVGLGSLGAVALTAVLLLGIDLPGTRGEDMSFLWVDVAGRIVMVVLLVICKSRGAYFKEA